ncbi:MAG: 4Fe-4S dicluster domain-containing protein [Candidatus Odinarchaeia archaeon]
MSNYIMIIDLNRCVRCRTCYVACKREHNILAHPRDNEHPYEYYSLRYVEWEHGEYPNVKRTFIPIHCMHCEDPICIKFCPVDAITQNNSGILQIDKNRCNGCGVCAAVCPYGALYIGPDGKAGGCDFCIERLKKKEIPKCVEICPGGARFFGDLNDSESKVFKLLESGIAKPLLLKGIKKTRVYYIPSTKEPNWNTLPFNENFLKSLSERKIDLPPIKGVL